MVNILDIHPLDITQMLSNNPEPLEMVLPGLLSGTVGTCVSPGGVGKSTFLGQAGFQIATGFDSLGLGDVPRGRVVILNAEDPDKALHHRMYSFGRQFDLSAKQKDDARQNLAIYSLLGKSPDLLNPNHVNWIKSVTDGARLIVVDTITRFHSLDENKAVDAKSLMSVLEELACVKNAAVIFLHQVSKSAALNGMSEMQQAARGSSVFVDNARWASFLCGMTMEEEKFFKVGQGNRYRFIRWNISKQNYSEPLKDLWLERKKGGVLVPAGFKSIAINNRDETGANTQAALSAPSNPIKNKKGGRSGSQRP